VRRLLEFFFERKSRWTQLEVWMSLWAQLCRHDSTVAPHRNILPVRLLSGIWWRELADTGYWPVMRKECRKEFGR